MEGHQPHHHFPGSRRSLTRAWLKAAAGGALATSSASSCHQALKQQPLPPLPPGQGAGSQPRAPGPLRGGAGSPRAPPPSAEPRKPQALLPAAWRGGGGGGEVSPRSRHCVAEAFELRAIIIFRSEYMFKPIFRTNFWLAFAPPTMTSTEGGWSQSLCSSCKAPPQSPPSVDLTESTEMNNEEQKEEESVENEVFEHSFEAGDHVIRWEMLPIVYPIQIHGIVLECGEESVTIADFGLTAYQQGEEGAVDESLDGAGGISGREASGGAETGADGDHTKEGQDGENNDSVKDDAVPDASSKQALKDSSTSVRQQKLQESSSFHLKRVTDNKSRLNVTTIRSPKEIKAWKKVNYGENMFTKSLKKSQSSSWWKLGSRKDRAEMSDTTNEEMDEATGEQQEAKVTEGSYIPENVNDTDGVKAASNESTSVGQPGKIDSSEQVSPSSKAPNGPDSGAPNELTNIKQQTDETTKIDVLSQVSPSESASPNARKSWWASRNKTSTGSALDQTKGEVGTSTKPGWWKSWTTSSKSDYLAIPKDQVEQEEIAWADAGRPQLTQRHMNPAMLSLMSKQSEEKEQEDRPKHEPQKLPKADPPKVVLARTKFLLENGESVLPPYHVFASNSECIAVWCMTGRWSTLQASVFLHSTAIGHAKTATAITLGVAATQPWLVPALAVVGGAAVGMPWIILKRSKDRWEAATIRLNDLFWAQAEPEVFVECIEKWGKLGGGTDSTEEAVVVSV